MEVKLKVNVSEIPEIIRSGFNHVNTFRFADLLHHVIKPQTSGEPISELLDSRFMFILKRNNAHAIDT